MGRRIKAGCAKITPRDIINGVAERRGVDWTILPPKLDMVRKTGGGGWFFVLQYHEIPSGEDLKLIRAMRLSDMPLDWWVDQGCAFLDGDASTVDVMD